MSRLKAVYRSWAIHCAGRDLYYARHRAEWLGKISHPGTRRRAEQLYQQLDMLQQLRQQARRELLLESRRHAATIRLRQIPYVEPIRAALLVALIQTPHRFRTKRQLWPTVAWPWKRVSAANTTISKANCNAPGRCWPSAD